MERCSPFATVPSIYRRSAHQHSAHSCRRHLPRLIRRRFRRSAPANAIKLAFAISSETVAGSKFVGRACGAIMRSFLVAAVVASASISGAAQAADISSGSGVVVGDHGEVLTNAHVVKACAQIIVRSPAGGSATAQLIARDDKNDLAVVRTRPLSSVATFRDGKPVRAGDAIVALGYPLSGLLATEANLSVGNVSALAGVADDTRYLQISAPVQPGNSGGPLLDASGHLVGIVAAKLNALRVARFTGDIPENVNFAIKAEVARTFLESKGIKYQMERSDKQLSPADVGEVGRPFTVHIECERAGARPVAAIGSPNPSQDQQTEPCKDYVHPSSLSKKTVDAIIEACSIVIGSTQVFGPKVAEAFLIRGAAYRIKHEYLKANQDLKNAASSSYASDKTVAAAARLIGTMALVGEFGYGAMDAMTWFNVAANAMANIASLWAQGLGVAEKNCDFAREWRRNISDEIETEI